MHQRLQLKANWLHKFYLWWMHHNIAHRSLFWSMWSLIARFMGPTWGPSGADRTQVGPMLAPWTSLSGMILKIPNRIWTVARSTVNDLGKCNFISDCEVMSYSTITTPTSYPLNTSFRSVDTHLGCGAEFIRQFSLVAAEPQAFFKAGYSSGAIWCHKASCSVNELPTDSENQRKSHQGCCCVEQTRICSWYFKCWTTTANKVWVLAIDPTAASQKWVLEMEPMMVNRKCVLDMDSMAANRDWVQDMDSMSTNRVRVSYPTVSPVPVWVRIPAL